VVNQQLIISIFISSASKNDLSIMKHFITTAMFSIIGFVAIAQDTALFNNGSLIYINGDALVQINGDFINEPTSNYTNLGTVNVIGDFTNNQTMLSPFSGMLNFEGSVRQYVNGSAPLLANDVTINNPNGVALNNVLRITGEVNFVAGILSAQDTAAPLQLSNTGTVSTVNPAKNTSHVLGYVVKTGTGSFTYPVGDSFRYQPISTNLSANSAGMRVRYDTSDAGVAGFSTSGSDPTALLYYNQYEYWDITPIGTATGTVTIYWDNYRNDGIGSASDLRVAHKSGGSWQNEGTVGVGTVAAGSVTSNSLSTWSPFALGSISISSPLPLQLLSFKGNAYKAFNQLLWEAANEIALVNYELQRSSDGRYFETITNIAAQHSSSNSYQYNDSILFTGNLYYRLKMNTNNNQVSYSNTIRFQLQSASKESIVFPNPAQDNVFLSLADDALIGTSAILFDMQGKRIQVVPLDNKMVNINLSFCSVGTYTLRLTNGEVFHIVKTQ
jgi:hypothetical protein